MAIETSTREDAKVTECPEMPYKTIISVNSQRENGNIRNINKFRSISSSSPRRETQPSISIPIRSQSVATGHIRTQSLDSTLDSEQEEGPLLYGGGKCREGSAKVRKLCQDRINLLTEVFNENLGEHQSSLTVLDFKSMFQFKREFCVKRVFNIFDKQHQGFVTLQNFIDTVEYYSSFDDDAKIEFFLDMYDADGDITKHELKLVLTDCMVESGVTLRDQDIDNLTSTLFQDCVKDGREAISKEDLREELKKHKELLSNISILIDKWLKPRNAQKKNNSTSLLSGRYFSADYWRNNKSFHSFLFLVLITNFLIFTHRAYYFRNFPMLSGFVPNPFYMISRGLGRTLLFNTSLVLILVLRYTITMLRQFGLAKYLPLDHNIYFHKVVGTIIFFQGMTHSCMHFLNFGINIQPDPVKFIQLSWNYWYDYGYYPLDLYTIPAGCQLVGMEQEESKDCLAGSLEMPTGINLEVSRNITVCQACSSGQPYTYFEWLFTRKPGMFGMAGSASLSGIALMLVLLVIFICSLPFVRRSGHFQVFYVTHMLYFAYFLLMFLHAPDFWSWFLVPAIVWIIEVFYRSVGAYLSHGKTVICSGTILPSKVTCLFIKKPARFNFNAGDYVYVKIPAVATSEWHPFTISSAPEVKDVFTLHVRGVGGWTNSLYTLFEKNYKKQQGVSINTDTVFSRGKFNRSVRNHNRLRNTKSVTFSQDPNDVNNIKQVDLLGKQMDIYIDGPFGSPSSSIFRAEHAILICTGIGVTPFASILQSIMHRYWEIKQRCPRCNYTWSNNIEKSMFNLRKVDFYWINRNVNSFEWFVDLMSQLEHEQAEQGGQLDHFLNLHMYNTSALKKDDMKGFALQMAMDLLYAKEEKDLMTGLKARTIPGRPNWDEVFGKIKYEMKGEVTVFYCGNPTLATTLKYKCDKIGFNFKKEVF